MSETGKVTVTEKSSAERVMSELSATDQVLGIVCRQNYFPALCSNAAFVATVVSNCGADLSERNIIDTAFEVAQTDVFIVEIRNARLAKLVK